ncbi:hypothetical protein Dimus_016623 [Dionaea muscipula]
MASSSGSPDPAKPNQTLSAQKKPQPLPWTYDETVNLIQAYQEKWYSLKRGQLKATQWDEVAATVAARCGLSQPTKTGTQCRHKLEKLRKRYRADRQRSRRPFWPYFDLMDQLQRGPLPISVAVPMAPTKINSSDDDDKEEEPPRTGYSLRSRGRQSAAAAAAAAAAARDRRMDEYEELIDGFSVGDGKRKEFSARGDGYSSLTSGGRRRAVEFGYDSSSRFKKRKSAAALSVDGGGGGGGEGEDEEEAAVVGVGRGGDGGGVGLVEGFAKQMREFADSFLRMERKKMEMMRENERYRMEMENKRMEMIIVAQQKTVDLISRAFGSSKKVQGGGGGDGGGR